MELNCDGLITPTLPQKDKLTALEEVNPCFHCGP